jgi:uncharacterized UPF0160 family protein
MNTIQIKIEKFQKINDGVLYEWYEATNLTTNETRKEQTSTEYYGDDIINQCVLSEDELNNLPLIFGKKNSEKITISSEIRTYSDEKGEEELTAEGWASSIHNAILYVMY